jgi:predicted peptidase
MRREIPILSIMQTRFIFFLIGFLLCVNTMNAQDKPQDRMQKAHKFSRKITKTVGCDYLVWLPKNYDAKSKKGSPLILFLHGAGERGTNLWKATTHGPSKYIADHPDFPFLLITPLCPANSTWSDEILLALLDEVTKKFSVDETRIYLTGLSMGGFGAWSLGLAYPEKFAAIAPICGGGSAGPIILARNGYDPKRAKALKTLPVWVFHGAKDPVVPVEESERLVKALRQLGIEEIDLTIYPEAQHNSWTETYKNPELYEWFLKHQRK